MSKVYKNSVPLEDGTKIETGYKKIMFTEFFSANYHNKFIGNDMWILKKYLETDNFIQNKLDLPISQYEFSIPKKITSIPNQIKFDKGKISQKNYFEMTYKEQNEIIQKMIIEGKIFNYSLIDLLQLNEYMMTDNGYMLRAFGNPEVLSAKCLDNFYCTDLETYQNNQGIYLVMLYLSIDINFNNIYSNLKVNTKKNTHLQPKNYNNDFFKNNISKIIYFINHIKLKHLTNLSLNYQIYGKSTKINNCSILNKGILDIKNKIDNILQI